MAYIADLLNENTREAALLELSKKREQVPELALILWHSFGVMTSLMQEIISVYTLLNPSQLTAAASNRVCNALALLQCVASHNDTRTLFLNGEKWYDCAALELWLTETQRTFLCSSIPFLTRRPSHDRLNTYD